MTRSPSCTPKDQPAAPNPPIQFSCSSRFSPGVRPATPDPPLESDPLPRCLSSCYDEVALCSNVMDFFSAEAPFNSHVPSTLMRAAFHSMYSCHPAVHDALGWIQGRGGPPHSLPFGTTDANAFLLLDSKHEFSPPTSPFADNTPEDLPPAASNVLCPSN